VGSYCFVPEAHGKSIEALRLLQCRWPVSCFGFETALASLNNRISVTGLRAEIARFHEPNPAQPEPNRLLTAKKAEAVDLSDAKLLSLTGKIKSGTLKLL